MTVESIQADPEFRANINTSDGAVMVTELGIGHTCKTQWSYMQNAHKCILGNRISDKRRNSFGYLSLLIDRNKPSDVACTQIAQITRVIRVCIEVGYQC